MRIQHNIPALSAYRNYTRNVSMVNKNLEKLSSGYKINRAGDDAAGLAISEKMRIQISGLEQAQNNAKSGINLVQTAEGALTEVHDMLNRMYTLAEQSANGTYADEVDREQLQKEIESLRTEINRIADATNYNGISLLNGKLGFNDKAFEVSEVAATTGGAVEDAFTTPMPDVHDDGNASSVVGTDTVLHEDGKDFVVDPSFTIDVSAVTIAKGTGNTQFKIKLGGGTESAAIDLKTAASKDANGKDIAEALVKAFDGSAANKSIQIDKDGNVSAAGAAAAGSLYYKATAAGDGKVKFELAGYGAANGNFTAYTGDEAAKKGLLQIVQDGGGTAALNKSLDMDVEIVDPADTGANGKVTRGENILVTESKQGSAKTPAKFANTFFTLNMSKIKDGTVLEIAGEKYTFAIGEGSAYKTAAGAIDLTDIVKDAKDLSGVSDAAVKAAVMNKINNSITNSTFTVGVDGAEWGKLSLAEKNDGAGKSLVTDADKLKAMSTLDGLKGMVSLKAADTDAGTAIKVTNSAVKEGDTLKIGDKTYVFSDKKSGTEGDTTYVAIAGGAGQNLANAITGAKYAGTTVTIDPAKVTGKGLTLQIGDTPDTYNKMNVSVKDMHAKAMGIGEIDISTQDGASEAMTAIKNATNYVSDVRGDLGALQNRLDHTINNLSVTQENITDAESTIRDVDIAKEMMAYTKNNILVQSAQAMLAQANQLPQGVLQLLG